MLTSIVATDRNEVELTANSIRGEAWVLMKLNSGNPEDRGWVTLSFNIEVARKLVALLPEAIEEAEELAAEPAAVASDA